VLSSASLALSAQQCRASCLLKRRFIKLSHLELLPLQGELGATTNVTGVVSTAVQASCSITLSFSHIADSLDAVTCQVQGALGDASSVADVVSTVAKDTGILSHAPHVTLQGALGTVKSVTGVVSTAVNGELLTNTAIPPFCHFSPCISAGCPRRCQQRDGRCEHSSERGSAHCRELQAGRQGR
jgi:hypothetical protein